jgi:hypothetical protein
MCASLLSSVDGLGDVDVAIDLQPSFLGYRQI